MKPTTRAEARLEGIRDGGITFIEAIPVALVLMTDLTIPYWFGHGLSIGGISVAGILMGSMSRICGSVSTVVKERAQKVDKEDRGVFYSGLWVALALAFVIALGLFYFREGVERLIGLRGIAAYLKWGAWYWLGFRACTVFYLPLGVNKERLVGRAVSSWVSALLNIALTWHFVQSEGVSGSSKATLIALIPQLLLGVMWGSRLLQRPHLPTLRTMVYPVGEELKGSLTALLNSVTALFLNGWMGEQVALAWSLCHLCCDVAGELGLTLWGAGGRALGYWTYGEGQQPEWGRHIWRLVDVPAISIQVVCAVLASVYISPCAGIIVIAYAMNKRMTQLVASQGTDEASTVKFRAKLIWVGSCIVGYWACMFLAEPTIVIPTIVYLTAATGSSLYLYTKK